MEIVSGAIAAAFCVLLFRDIKVKQWAVVAVALAAFWAAGFFRSEIIGKSTEETLLIFSLALATWAAVTGGHPARIFDSEHASWIKPGITTRFRPRVYQIAFVSAAVVEIALLTVLGVLDQS
ncbi:hypothetical protein [Kitasatospora sp. CB01950]|uniref:hypothetical protein n=1 Tax=Kitasatospora sp. CB01950 TaxID=1703930 RepID=UPI00093CC255|nr:hypothetical protein [Kitasatospora sp. CB01950]OKI99111.1 hypothetical protein AMK19_31455 [Kitasatospora sp. CB01950]